MDMARDSRLSGLRVQYGRDLQYEQAQAPLPQEPAVRGGFAPEIAIGPNGFTFGARLRWGAGRFRMRTKCSLPIW
jgi:hypothetical protein